MKPSTQTTEGPPWWDVVEALVGHLHPLFDASEVQGSQEHEPVYDFVEGPCTDLWTRLVENWTKL